VSADATSLSSFVRFGAAVDDCPDDSSIDADLLEAARCLLAEGEVEFKLSRRVGPRQMSAWRFALYRFFCRDNRLPEWAKGAPLVAMQLGCYDSWADVVRECRCPDDQVLVMPRNRRYGVDGWHLAVECRPGDPADALRFRTLQKVFGVVNSPSLEDLEARLTRVERDLAALKAAKG
jgi:hypothetical protein